VGGVLFGEPFQLKDSFSQDTNLMADRIAEQIIRQIKLASI